jgi:hypothetical protein
MRSHPYVPNQALAGTYRTTAQAFASPSYLSSVRSYKTLLSSVCGCPSPQCGCCQGPPRMRFFTPWLKCLARLARNFDAESHEFYTPGPALHLPLDGSVILALPLPELRRLVTLQIADWAPHLPNVRYPA